MIGVFLVNFGGDIEFQLGIEDDEVYVGETAPKDEGWDARY